MNIQFSNSKTSFSLGTVSFGFLDDRDVFDQYQQDDSYCSETIFLNDGDRLTDLGSDILKAVASAPDLQESYRDKLTRFALFCKSSDRLSARVL